MPAEITVGPPVLTINQGTTFMVTDQRGEIEPESELGVFSGDTRFVSSYRVYLSGESWQLLGSAPVHYYTAQLQFMNSRVATEDGEIRPGDVGLSILRRVADGIHEDLDITSYAPGPVRFQLEIALRSDFADVHEVRAHQFIRRGCLRTTWDEARGELTNTYQSRGFERALRFRLTNASSPPRFANGRVVFDVELEPGQRWHACAAYVLVEGERVREPLETCQEAYPDISELERLQQEWLADATQLTSANEDVYRTFLRSVKDLGSLRMYDQDMAEDVWVPAAGVPWYVALFGRDSLIASLQTMLVQPTFARGALKKLAEHQATMEDDWRDAEPGKILHELRLGELARHGKLPFSPYYGSADATILFPIVLHEAWLWLGDDALLREHRAAALRCLDWIDRYGDLDGDGFQEYRTRSSVGYENVGWKDSWDAVVYPDGRLVPQPKALVELQGYVFDAKLRLAEVFETLGEPRRARELRRQAADLQRRFEESFWLEDLGFYAFALDPAKRPVATLTSNVGHCLWSGIVAPERAEQVVQRFLAEDFWSGWGIRTLSASHPAYNPYSYHRGSVWPHDNGLIALGFKRYGFADETNRLARDLFEAASHFQRYRLPELYGGLPRKESAFPVPYASANIPQAWAAGSVFHLLQAILGLRAHAPTRTLYVHPTLPRWLPNLQLTGLAVAGTRLTLRFWREGERSRWAVVDQRGGPEIRVCEEPWQPWQLTHRLARAA